MEKIQKISLLFLFEGQRIWKVTADRTILADEN
jgi:hypothetical protein